MGVKEGCRGVWPSGYFRILVACPLVSGRLPKRTNRKALGKFFETNEASRTFDWYQSEIRFAPQPERLESPLPNLLSPHRSEIPALPQLGFRRKYCSRKH